MTASPTPEPYDRNPSDAIEILLRYHDGMAERDPCRPEECKFMRSIACLRKALSPPSVPGEEPRQIDLNILAVELAEKAHACSQQEAWGPDLYAGPFLSILRRHLAAQPKAPSTTPGEVEALLYHAESALKAYRKSTGVDDEPILATLRQALASNADCPQCGWQDEQEPLDCEAAYEKATGQKPVPGSTFLDFRRGWIAGRTNFALASRESCGWVKPLPDDYAGDAMLLTMGTTMPVRIAWTDGEGEGRYRCLCDWEHNEFDDLAEYVDEWWYLLSVPPPPADTNEGRGA